MNDLLENNNTNNDLLSLFNKNKISNEVASLSSISSLSSSSSINSASNKNKTSIKIKKQLEEDDDNYNFKNKIILDSDDDNENDSDDEDEDEEDNKQFYNKRKQTNEEEDDDDDDDDEEDENDDIKSNSSENNVKSKRDIIAEKKEILYQLKRLEDKGHVIPNQYNMQSDLLEMKQEYERIIRDKDIDSSVRFQRKMLMAFVTGTEYLNTRYDPFAIKLEGWSEQVHENINDYDDIFEELHEKYKSKGRKMPAELRLFISLTGSAFMFHLTSRMFKESAIPGVEEVLKSNPALMKEFQNAAAKQFMYKNTGIGNDYNQSQPQRPTNQNNSGNGLFGMIGNLFGGLTNTANFNNNPMMPSQPKQNIRPVDKSVSDINNIINNVHGKISPHIDDDNRIETLSISDEEITSIIEDATDVNLLKKSVRGKNKRTLNI
jgi:hypothetical protein